MARLIVEARIAEPIGIYQAAWGAPPASGTRTKVPTFIGALGLRLGVSVSRADDGSSVTGLERSNFRVASSIGHSSDFKIAEAAGGFEEWKWEPGDRQPSGCYTLQITLFTERSELEVEKGVRFVFGVQARTFMPVLSRHGLEGIEIIDQGQTIVEVINEGF
jgi:hypothetical protein